MSILARLRGDFALREISLAGVAGIMPTPTNKTPASGEAGVLVLCQVIAILGLIGRWPYWPMLSNSTSKTSMPAGAPGGGLVP